MGTIKTLIGLSQTQNSRLHIVSETPAKVALTNKHRNCIKFSKKHLKFILITNTLFYCFSSPYKVSSKEPSPTTGKLSSGCVLLSWANATSFTPHYHAININFQMFTGKSDSSILHPRVTIHIFTEHSEGFASYIKIAVPKIVNKTSFASKDC